MRRCAVNIVIALAIFVPLNSLRAQTVYKTPSGQKYHLATCRSVKNVSQRITMAEAIKAGLQPCKICKPPASYGAVTPSPHKEQGTNQTVQCKGLTKSGIRCKHMTRIANGYCYQHQPG